MERTLSFRLRFQASRAFGSVKSQKAPSPPHQLPAAGFSGSLLSFRNVPCLRNSSYRGWLSSTPGFTFGATGAPFSFMPAKNASGSGKRARFQVKTQRFSPCAVYPEERWNPSSGKPSSRAVSIKSRMARSQSRSSSG